MSRALSWVIGLTLALALLGALAIRVPAVEDAIMRRVVARAVAASADELFREDALRVVLCGTSAPLPHPSRAKACVAVFAAGRFWVVDTGPARGTDSRSGGSTGSASAPCFSPTSTPTTSGSSGEYNLQTLGGRPSRALARLRAARRRTRRRGLRRSVRARHPLSHRTPRRGLPTGTPRTCRRGRSTPRKAQDRCSCSRRTASASPRSRSITGPSSRPTATASTTAAARWW